MSRRNTSIALLALVLLHGAALATADDAGDQQTYLSANGLLQRGLFDLAAADYEAFLAEHPRHEKADRARYGLAVCRFRLGDYPATLAALKPLDDDEFAFAAEVGALRAQALLATDATDECIEACAAFLAAHARHKLAENVTAILAEACQRAGRDADTLEVAKRFTRRWENSPLCERVWYFAASAHLAREEWADATRTLEQLLGTYPKSAFRAQALLLCGYAAERQSELSLATRRYREVLAGPATPEHGDALLALAGLARRAGDLNEALEHINRMLDTFPEHARTSEARLLRASVLLDRDELDAAGRDLVAVADEALADQVAYWQAKRLLRAGQAAEAAGAFAKAIDKHPDSPLRIEMRYDRCVALQAAGEDAAARRELAAFCKEHREHALAADALVSLINLTQAAGDLEEADRLARAFGKQHGDHPDAALATLLRADNAFQREAYEDALRGYRRVHEDAPDADLRSQSLLRIGLTLYRLERFDEAGDILAQCVEQQAAPSALLALGEIHFMQREWDSAAASFERYLASDDNGPGRAQALLKLGLARQRGGNAEAALAHFERLLEEFGDTDAARQARFERGQVLLALGRDDEAAEALGSATGPDGDPRLAGHAQRHLAQLAAARGDHAEAIRLAKKLIESDNDELRATGHLLAGRAHLQNGNAEAAEADLRAYLAADDAGADAPLARLQLAQALSRQDKLEEARTLLERWQKHDAGDIDPTLRAAALYELGWTLRRLDRNEDATAAFEALVRLDAPADLLGRGLVELAELHAADGDCGSAAKLLERVATLEVVDEVQAAAAYRRGVCAFEAEDYEQAARLLGRFVERFPEHPLEPSVRYFCGESLVRLNRHQAAIAHLRRVVEAFNEHESFGPSLVRLGDCLVARQQWAAASDAFARYRSVIPDGPLWHEAQFGVGWAAENQGRHEDAIRAYREVVARHKGKTAARAQFQIGECLFAQGRYEDAVRELLRVEILFAYPEWSAAALYEAGRCFEKLGRPVDARQQFKACCERYEDTRWAELARGRMAAVADELLPGRSGS